MISMQIKGVQRVIDRLGSYNRGVQVRVTAALDVTAFSLEANVKRLLSQPGTGRIYRRRSGTHRASAPGQPPAVDTGRLRASYHVEAPSPHTRTVGTSVRYAPYLEYGTRRMAARPHLGPAVEVEAPKFVQRMREALQEDGRVRTGRAASGGVL